MLVSKDCLDLKLVKTAHAADNFIWVSGGDAVKLNSIGVDNYINLTLSDNRACETVRYDHVATWPATSAPKQLPVIRDVGATGRKNFGVNSCAVADWSVTQLTEYIEQVACAAPCIGGNTAAIASLSTSTSTKLSATASAIASLSTGVGSKLSTSFVSLASLSTSTSAGLSAADSAIASLSTGVGSKLSTSFVSLASLSTSTSTGLSAADSAIASLSTLVTTKASLVGGTVPASQLPSYVDDVLEFPNSASFPAVGEAGKVYVDAGTNLTYRWSGTTYVALGGDYAVVARDQGTILTTAMDNINFIGAGVQATNTGSSVTVNVLDASATQAGSVELATPAETIAGTATTLAVTPAGLSSALNDSFHTQGGTLRTPAYNFPPNTPLTTVISHTLAPLVYDAYLHVTVAQNVSDPSSIIVTTGGGAIGLQLLINGAPVAGDDVKASQSQSVCVQVATGTTPTIEVKVSNGSDVSNSTLMSTKVSYILVRA